MMGKCIVYTRHDGGVSICHPAPQCLAWMSCGGYWGHVTRGFVETQIERGVADGRHPDAVRRFVHAILTGGCSTAEALEIIRDRDCAHLGTGCELWDVSDVSRDRWFRDAWTRSHNGGPILIDMRKARPIQFHKITVAVELENKRRATDLERFDDPLEPDWQQVRSAVKQAEDEYMLRRVWPSALVNLSKHGQAEASHASGLQSAP